MTVTTLKAAIALMHDPEIDSLWEYEGQNGQTLWAAYTKGQYCDIYGSCTALKHDGEITEMGQDLLDSDKSWDKLLVIMEAFDEMVEYPVSPETKKWWQDKLKENLTL